MSRFSCKDCQRPYGPPFLWVDDTTWSNIGCKPDEFLCAHCIIDRIYNNGRWVGYMVSGTGTHRITPANATITMTQNTKRDKVAQYLLKSWDMLSDEDQIKILSERTNENGKSMGNKP